MSKGMYNASMQIEMENMFVKILLFQFLRERKIRYKRNFTKPVAVWNL